MQIDAHLVKTINAKMLHSCWSCAMFAWTVYNRRSESTAGILALKKTEWFYETKANKFQHTWQCDRTFWRLRLCHVLCWCWCFIRFHGDGTHLKCYLLHDFRMMYFVHLAYSWRTRSLFLFLFVAWICFFFFFLSPSKRMTTIFACVCSLVDQFST